MKQTLSCAIGLLLLTMVACRNNDNRFGFRVEIPDFDFPETVTFADSLSAYNIFAGSPADLIPTDDFELLELNSILFTDYAHKQRLVKIPAGEQMTRLNDGSIDFPDGTILTKTFFYYHDERDTTLGKSIIETRLLVKEQGIWNVATYRWNEAQTAATLTLGGQDTQVSWVNTAGDRIATLYHVPSGNECIACHQSNSTMIPLGTTLRNLNRMVERNETSLNQISHLQSVEKLNNFSISSVPQMVDYKDDSQSLSARGRAYLDLNCSHCHNPNAWEEPAEEGLDFSYETPLNQTGLLEEQNEIIELITDGEMPFIGTTIIDQEGIDLVIEYIESL